ncbi:MAG: ABC transporter permease [Microthrixaceae bacterium]|nr:ABC transporter permease [Microthrixaceae bacterium]
MTQSAVLVLARRSVRARLSRIAATVLGLAVAVSFTVAAFGVAAQFERFVGDGTDAAAQAAAAVPQGAVVIAAPAGGVTQTTAVDEALLGRVRAVPGVIEASGSYDQPIGVRLASGVQADIPVVLRGLVFTSAWDADRWTVVEGRAPTLDGDAGGALPIALDAGGERSADASLGDTIELQTPIGGVPALVVGLVEPANPGQDGVEQASGGEAGAAPALSAGVIDARVVVDSQVLAPLLDAEGRLDRITALPAPGVELDDVAGALIEALPADLRITTADDADAVTAQTVRVISEGVATATLAFAVLSAVVAALLVSNTLAILVTQRNRELALMRCVGLTSAQAARIVFLEAGMVGVAGGLLGLGLGVPLSVVGASFIQPGAEVDLLVTPQMVIAAAGVGVAVTVIAAIMPALRASRVPPLAALVAADATPRRGIVGWAMTPLLLVVRAMSPSSGVRMAVDNARRDLRRSGATATTLIVGLGLISLVLTGSASIRAATEDQFVNASSADLYLERRGLVRISTEAMEQRLAEVGVTSGVVSVLAVDGRLDGPEGGIDQVSAARLDSIPQQFDLGLTGGAFPEEAAAVPVSDFAGTAGRGQLDEAGRVMLSDEASETLGAKVGDAVTLRSVSGTERDLRVVGTYQRTAFVGPAVVERADAERIGADGSFEVAAVDVPEGLRVRRSSRYLERNLNGFPKLRVHTPSEFAALNVGVADTVTRLVLVILSGALLVGALGAANTISLSVMERRRELGLLRAVGATAAQVRSLVRTEALVICGLAAAVAMVAGVGLAVLAVSRAPAEFAAEPLVPWPSLAVVGVAALAIGATSAALATRRQNAGGPLDAL